MSKFRTQLFRHLGITLGLIVALSVGVVYFVNRIKTASDLVATSRKSVTDYSASLAALAALRAQYKEKGEQYLTLLHGAIIERDTFISAGVGEKLQTLARRLDLSSSFILTDEISPSATTNGIGSIGFRLELRGEVNAFVTFLNLLKTFPYILDIGTVTITKETNQSKMDMRGRILLRQSANE